MEVEHIFVVFWSHRGRDPWYPIERENIPDWLRDEAIINRMLAGEQVRNTDEKDERYYKIVEIDRPRPAGTRDARMAAQRAAEGKSAGGILVH
jgi:hypothetical protein